MPHQPSNAPWFIPAKAMKLPDGSTLVVPGKAIQRAKAADVAKMTGLHRHTLAALAECGLIRRAMPAPRSPHYYPGEVEALIERTESDPDFWNEVRTKAFLKGRSLVTAKPSA